MTTSASEATAIWCFINTYIHIYFTHHATIIFSYYKQEYRINIIYYHHQSLTCKYIKNVLESFLYQFFDLLSSALETSQETILEVLIKPKLLIWQKLQENRVQTLIPVQYMSYTICEKINMTETNFAFLAMKLHQLLLCFIQLLLEHLQFLRAHSSRCTTDSTTIIQIINTAITKSLMQLHFRN